jgi:SAM-dependent methyltransferase
MEKPPLYGRLHSIFYDATKSFAPEREVSFYAYFIEQNPGRVLEAMSGSGRLQIPLIQKGYVVDGVDNSAIMLERCKKRCAQLNISPVIFQQSVEAFKSPYQYATVTIAVGSFQLITDRADALAALQNIRRHMIENGTLLIDIFIPDLQADKRSVREVRIDDQTIIRLTTRYIFDEANQKADAYLLYEKIVNGVPTEQENELMQLVWYSDDQIRELLVEAGFMLIAIHEETFRKTGPSRIVQAQPFNNGK